MIFFSKGINFGENDQKPPKKFLPANVSAPKVITRTTLFHMHLHKRGILAIFSKEWPVAPGEALLIRLIDPMIDQKNAGMGSFFLA